MKCFCFGRLLHAQIVAGIVFVVCVSCSPTSFHEGNYSVHEYNFKGRSEAHTEEEIKKYGLEDYGNNGANVSANCHVEWPELGSGLTKEALAKVRKAILWMAFSSEAPAICHSLDNPLVYIVPEALGETDVSLKQRIKVLCPDWEEGEFGLSPADWSMLKSEILLPDYLKTVTDEVLVTDNSLSLAFAGIMRRVNDSYPCKVSDKDHHCSLWQFCADVHLDWPFGIEPRADAKKHERPVICVLNNGYSNDGGNGCHSFYYSKVFSLPDGRALGMRDYFEDDKIKELSAYVWKRMVIDNEIKEEYIPDDASSFDLEDIYISMSIGKDGVSWSLSPYTFFPGCYGIVSVTVKWEDLDKFLIK